MEQTVAAAKPSEQLQLHAFQKKTNLRQYPVNPELFSRLRILQWQSLKGFSKEKTLI